jgi:hypothetical protein
MDDFCDQKQTPLTDADRRRQLVDDRRRVKVLRDLGLLDPDYPTGHFDSIIQTMMQVFEVIRRMDIMEGG